MSRGFFCVALVGPKSEPNIGGAFRAAHCYGANLIVVSIRKVTRLCTDTTHAARHIPVLVTANVLDAIPHGCVPIAVECIPDAKPLPAYQHPERAFYVFGPEDGSVPPAILARCRDKVIVPTRHCMNLAATVNVVLYDRKAKEAK